MTCQFFLKGSWLSWMNGVLNWLKLQVFISVYYSFFRLVHVERTSGIFLSCGMCLWLLETHSNTTPLKYLGSITKLRKLTPQMSLYNFVKAGDPRVVSLFLHHCACFPWWIIMNFFLAMSLTLVTDHGLLDEVNIT